MSPLKLSELNALVRDVLQLSMPADYWVVAEVSELRVAASNGHCYLELIEKDDKGTTLRAKASAHIWRSTYALLRTHFEQKTGQPLSAGMKILVQVEVDFHSVYGYSLNITDIDPTYTLGDMAARRQEILQQLETDGVLELNKELPLPRPLTRLAVVSSATAAGYGDFCKQLEATPYRFLTTLFPATMQGEQVEPSIIEALDSIAEHSDDYDAVVIIRGGGAVSDLQGFESYLLAANVAQFPLPVLTGIGHERDETVIDLVAHTRLKTPTAVAAFIIDLRNKEAEQLRQLEAQLEQAATGQLQTQQSRFERAARRLSLAATQFGSKQREHLLRLGSRLDTAARREVVQQQTRLETLALRLPPLALARLQRERARIELLTKQTELLCPDRILSLGYSITRAAGQIVRSPHDVQPGTLLETQVAEGTIRSRAE
ncbi:MAG: exodeoxyribonuclease VII large subunit [Alloprevotella sp.]|nr:exodeoxyribonuclease VII large subunit [Alloprevotella sp.]